MSKLPDKPSELIRLALADLRKCESYPAYKIDFNRWHYPELGGACCVCLAGSVIAQSLGKNPRFYSKPSDYNSDTEMKLEALDDFRSGNVDGGLFRMNIYEPGQRKYLHLNRNIPLYELSREDFHEVMESLADDLEKAGL